jgi:hypothetical protein
MTVNRRAAPPKYNAVSYDEAQVKLLLAVVMMMMMMMMRDIMFGKMEYKN